MIFSNKSIQDILNNKKCQTRRLVKEGEELRDWDASSIGGKHQIFVVNSKNKYRVKWKVRNEYVIQNKRGGSTLGLCDCKKLFTETETRCHAGWKPIYLEFIHIKKEKLLNITEEDAKKEGYKSREEFINAFWKINKNNLKQVGAKTNPYVWVITFKRRS